MSPPATTSPAATAVSAAPALTTTPEPAAAQESTQQTQTVHYSTHQAPTMQGPQLQVYMWNEPPLPGDSLPSSTNHRKSCHHQLTRDDRLRVKTLHEVGHPRNFIASHLGIFENQVRYAIHAPLSPKKRSGRLRKLSQEQVEELLHFVGQNETTKKMTYPALARHFSHWNVSEHTPSVML
ncbi:hypothetical protein J1614_011923 [Plenodomus biglobosus]|nr:hypothetical protein J1614_011923 [Plenodomus biglobosus]